MTLIKKLISLTLMIGLLASCGSEKEAELSAPQITTVKKFDNALAHDIVIPKDMLSFPHLLNVAIISGAPAPTGSALANKIVTFEKRKQKLYMFQSMEGRLSSSSIETKDFLAQFDIIGETEDGYIVDFEEGFDLIFQKRSMGSSVGGEEQENVYSITHSYVDSAKIEGKYASIKQFVRVKVPASAEGPESNISLELKYSFSPYVSSPSFEPKVSTKLQKVGYFENHPLLDDQTGATTTYITKFDTTKPIVYYLTSNIPQNYVDAVKEGILYWNKAFGKEVIKIEKLPAGVTIHDPGYNVIQWLDWDTSGFAYANLHADPLTGETLQGFVYMTSVFGNGGLESAKWYLRRYLANKKTKQTEVANALTIKGFAKHEICEHKADDMDKLYIDVNSLITTLETDEDLSETEKEEIFQRFAKDYIRQVVAHEVGHTLGLRHNFAGSHKNNLKPEDYDHLAKVFFLTGKVPNTIVPGSTVMDYTPGIISAMQGAIIREGKEVLSYDKQAIEWGYTNKSADEIDFDPFCTDHQADREFIDCKRFDNFADPISGFEKEFDMRNNNWSFYLVTRYEAILDESFRKKTLEQRLDYIKNVSLTPRENLKSYLGDYIEVLKGLTPAYQFISVRDQFPATLTAMDEADYLDATNLKKQESADMLADGQGFASFLFDRLTPKTNENNKTETPTITKIKSMIETNIANVYAEKVDQEEINLIRERLNKYFSVFEAELHLALVQIYQTVNFMVQDQNFNEKLTNYTKALLLTVDPSNVVTTYEDSKEVVVTNPETGEQTTETVSETKKVFNYYYQYQSQGKDLRMEASKMLSHNYYPVQPSFTRDMLPYKQTVFEEHKKVMNTILGGGRSPYDLEASVYDWVTFERYRFSPLSK